MVQSRNIIPEVVLYNHLTSLLKTVEQTHHSLKSSGNEERSLLDASWGGLELNGFDFYKEAEAIFTETSHPRKIKVYQGFNRDRTITPSIHILMPSDEPGEIQALGGQMGEYDTFEDNEVRVESRGYYSDSYLASYNFMVASDNSFEVLIIYHTIKKLISATRLFLEDEGFTNLTLSGMEINFDDSFVPPNTYSRILTLRGNYMCHSAGVNSEEFIKIFKLNLKSVEK